MSRFQKATIFLIAMIIGKMATAATYTLNGKEISKGEAIAVLIKDPSAKVVKSDLVYFDKDKGTLRNRPKN